MPQFCYQLLTISATLVAAVKCANGPPPLLGRERAVEGSWPIEVNITCGRVRGERLLMGAEEYTVFKGIPYARPPVGRFRFHKVERPAPWKGVANATAYKQSCYQWHTMQKHSASRYERIYSNTPDYMAEDCLYLNVFSPPPYTNETYPVIVFIHPGGYQIGSASDFKQEPILDHFVKRKVVFVTFNYRLGPFGFITLKPGNEKLPGNLGLWDMVLALKWVNTDIGSFGGDPKRITLMGQGSGASAASLLSVSPAASHLFARTILLSGTGITPGAVRSTAVNATWALERALNCRAHNSTALFTCLKNIMPEEIVGVSRAYYDDYQEFVPIVDPQSDLLPKAPHLMLSETTKKPTLLGTTKDEASLTLAILRRHNMNMSYVDKKAAEYLIQNLTKSYNKFRNPDLVAKGCMYEYVMSRAEPQLSESDVLAKGLLELYTHFWYTAPAAQLALWHTEEGQPAAYLYSFDHVSENLFVGSDGENEWAGAFHGIDMVLLLETDYHFLRERRDRNWQNDRRVIEVFAELLTNFVRTGQPTPKGSGFSFDWKPVSANQLNYLSITDDPRINVGYHWRGHVFWNDYVYHLNETDVGNLDYIAQLQGTLANYQLATWILLCTALFFFAILVGLAFYCTRKDDSEDDL